MSEKFTEMATPNGGPASDDELPGMWERADFIGGATWSEADAFRQSYTEPTDHGRSGILHRATPGTRLGYHGPAPSFPAGTQPEPPASDEHDWRPTTATHAVFKCRKCSAVGFAPHPLPRDGPGPVCDTGWNAALTEIRAALSVAPQPQPTSGCACGVTTEHRPHEFDLVAGPAKCAHGEYEAHDLYRPDSGTYAVRCPGPAPEQSR